MDLLAFFLIISSGSILCSAVFNKKYEDVLPITCSAIILVLFVFGLCNCLQTGAIIVCILSAICYVVALIWMIKQKDFKRSLSNFFSNGFFVFLLWNVICAFSIYGKLLHSWDEFSHWGYIVKAMATIDDFGTNPIADALFPSYPPGMSLFQYFLQKLYMWGNEGFFSEWRLYLAYQVLMFSFVLPFFGGKIKTNIFCSIVSVIIIFLAPLLFYREIYSTLYIDPFLGILSGSGIAMVLWTEDRDRFYSMRILSVCSILVLAKDAGMLFAMFIGVLYFADYLIEYKKYSTKKLIFIGGSIFLSIALPRILWNLEVSINKVHVNFSNPIDFGELIKIVLLQDETYRNTVWRGFWTYFVIFPVQVGDTGIKVNYCSLILFFFLILAFLIKIGKHKNIISSQKEKLVIGTVAVQTIIYMIGLVITYLFKFSEYEALKLASYERYINIHYCAVWIVIILSFIHLLYKIKEEKKNWYAFIVVVLMIMFMPISVAFLHITRDDVRHSINVRWEYNVIVDKVINQTEPSDRIYVIVQEGQGAEYHVMHFLFMPRSIKGSDWSIGDAFYEGDIWTVNKTSEEWIEELCVNYDYVVLYKVNDYFIDNYGELFESTEIINNGLYRVDKESQRLVFVE